MSEPISDEYIKEEAIINNFLQEFSDPTKFYTLGAFPGLKEAIESMMEKAYYYDSLVKESWNL